MQAFAIYSEDKFHYGVTMGIEPTSRYQANHVHAATPVSASGCSRRLLAYSYTCSHYS